MKFFFLCKASLAPFFWCQPTLYSSAESSLLSVIVFESFPHRQRCLKWQTPTVSPSQCLVSFISVFFSPQVPHGFTASFFPPPFSIGAARMGFFCSGCPSSGLLFCWFRAGFSPDRWAIPRSLFVFPASSFKFHALTYRSRAPVCFAPRNHGE